jgi:hypothetical protein
MDPAREFGGYGATLAFISDTVWARQVLCAKWLGSDYLYGDIHYTSTGRFGMG